MPSPAPAPRLSTTRLVIDHVATVGHARERLAQGFCPVECSFGAESVVDDLRMDHHGALAGLEPVSLRAWRDHPGARAADPRFVVTGAGDADATFALATLAGLLPAAPECPILPALARAIARADVDPLAERWEETPEGVLLLCYKQQMQNSPHTADSFLKGAQLWRTLTTEPPADLVAEVQAKERARVAQARQAAVIRLGPEIAFVECPAWGWDVWYAEVAPVIVAYQAKTRRCSIGCRDEETARRLFGQAGLLGLVEKLQPPGWGGRATIIGSPRDLALPREAALRAAQLAIRVPGAVSPPVLAKT